MTGLEGPSGLVWKGLVDWFGGPSGLVWKGLVDWFGRA